MIKKETIPGTSTQPELPGNNAALATIFHRMSDCYRYLGKDERFRATAYENVARILHNMKEDISVYATDINSLDEIKGIGKSIAEKIIEYLHTGRIKAFDELKSQVPYKLVEIMDISGFGPATARALFENLHIRTKEDLIRALESDSLKGVKGFGEKKIVNMKRVFKLAKESKRMPFETAEITGNELLQKIRKMPGVQKAELAGSLRRKKETIGDIDIIILAPAGYRKKIVSLFTSLPQVGKILAKGSTKASVILKKGNVQVDIRLVNDYEYGAALLYFTGPKEYNVKLRIFARNRGYKLNEYGLFEISSGKRLAGSTEKELYQFLKLKYIPPELRSEKTEFEQPVLPHEVA